MEMTTRNVARRSNLGMRAGDEVGGGVREAVDRQTMWAGKPEANPASRARYLTVVTRTDAGEGATKEALVEKQQPDGRGAERKERCRTGKCTSARRWGRQEQSREGRRDRGEEVRSGGGQLKGPPENHRWGGSFLEGRAHGLPSGPRAWSCRQLHQLTCRCRCAQAPAADGRQVTAALWSVRHLRPFVTSRLSISVSGSLTFHRRDTYTRPSLVSYIRYWRAIDQGYSFQPTRRALLPERRRRNLPGIVP